MKLDGSIVTIGRLPDNMIQLMDEQASRHHCVIEPCKGGYRLRDLGSSNGTILNNLKVEKDFLDNGDVVKIGTCELRFIDPEQQKSRKRRKEFPAPTPDDSPLAPTYDKTIDLDLNEAVIDAQTSYEKRLMEIINSGVDKTFDENDISLVDARGTTIHQATSSGLQTGSDDEAGESIRVFRLLLLACFRARATDLHIEPRRENATIRLRVDGYMLSAVELSLNLYRRILGIIKVLCQIESSLKNMIQDGHFSVAIKGRRVDYRVSLTPSLNGQKLVLRVLDTGNAPSRLHELGMLPWMYEKLQTIATRDAGMLLVSGPTGSGKTTTLYSCLREINVDQRNAITIEDPVEYYLEGCTQIPVDHKQGNTFANILRSILRQDPDVIFIGEVRDIETANTAMQAAMTGHLVYTTVHSKDTIGAIFRLLDLGVEAYLVANALNLIVAQRLVRMLCETCKKPVRPKPAQTLKMGTHLGGISHLYAPAGCKRCLRTGYIGRRALFELLEVDDNMRDIILKTPTIQSIRSCAKQGLFTSLQQFGHGLVAQGATAFDEIEKVTGSD